MCYTEQQGGRTTEVVQKLLVIYISDKIGIKKHYINENS